MRMEDNVTDMAINAVGKVAKASGLDGEGCKSVGELTGSDD